MTIGASQTRRPGSSPGIEPELVDLGSVLRSQAALERAWERLRVEHETFASTATAMHREVTELRTEVRVLTETADMTHALMRRLAKLAPLGVVLLELGRELLLRLHH